jgi:hypothetical protein
MKVVFLDMDGVLVTRLPGVAESKLVRPVRAPHAEHARVLGARSVSGLWTLRRGMSH